MRGPVLLLLIPTSLWGLSNAVTVYEAAGKNQPGRPISIARWFARGEIAKYPQPYILGGAAITPWQADVKTRWTDGSVQFAIVSFKWNLEANGSVRVEFRNAAAASSLPGDKGLTPAQLLAFNGGTWGAKIETVASGVTQSADARTMLAALASAPDQLRCWLCGPVVTQMIVEDRTTALAYDWGYQGFPITLKTPAGDASADTITSKGHGLSAGTPVWLAVKTNTRGSLPGGLSVGRTYNVVSPAADTFQLADAVGGPLIDLTSSGSNFEVFQPYSDVTWRAADAAHKSLHPIFVITAYAGWPGVRAEYILENTWAERIQDQYFGSLKLYSGTGNRTTAAAMAGFVHSSRTRWRKICWDGAAPAGEPACGTDTAVTTPRAKGLLIDYNFPYMVYSGAVMPFDTTRKNLAFRLNAFWDIYTKSAGDPREDLTRGDIEASTPPGTVHASGPLASQQYQTGVDNWGNIGFMPTVQALHLYVMGDTSQNLKTRAHAAEMAIDPYFALSYFETHYRESNPQKKYLPAYLEPARTTVAFGKPISPDARPTLTTIAAQAAATDPADRVILVGEVRLFSDGGDLEDGRMIGVPPTNYRGGDNNCFESDVAHSWLPIWNSYLLLGDWYAMEELQYWAGWYMAASAPGLDGRYESKTVPGRWGRHGSWGLSTNIENFRIRGWGERAKTYAIAATPTEDPAYAPVRTLLKSKYRLDLFAHEGVADIRNGLFASVYPEFRNWDCKGWNNSTFTLPGLAPDNPQTAWCWGRENQAGGKPNPLGFPGWLYFNNKPFIDTTVTNERDDAWHWEYWSHVNEYAARLGNEDAITFVPYLRRFWLDFAMGEGWLANANATPVTDNHSLPFTTWEAARAGFKAPFLNMKQWCWDKTAALPPGCDDFPYAVGSSSLHMLRASVALAEPQDSATNKGHRVYEWMQSQVPFQNHYGTPGDDDPRVNPRYAWIAQFIRNVQVVPGTNQATLQWSTFSGDACKVGVAAAPFASTDSTSDVSTSLQADEGRYRASGLTPSTLYYYRITCGPNEGTVRVVGKFKTSGGSTQPPEAR